LFRKLKILSNIGWISLIRGLMWMSDVCWIHTTQECADESTIWVWIKVLLCSFNQRKYTWSTNREMQHVHIMLIGHQLQTSYWYFKIYQTLRIKSKLLKVPGLAKSIISGIYDSFNLWTPLTSLAMYIGHSSLAW
jgi:hypothetical protein